MKVCGGSPVHPVETLSSCNPLPLCSPFVDQPVVHLGTGVSFPPRVVTPFHTVETLVGFGLKTVTFLRFRVYVVGFYLPEDAKTLLVDQGMKVCPVPAAAAAAAAPKDAVILNFVYIYLGEHG